jgi:hypothetical protein
MDVDAPTGENTSVDQSTSTVGEKKRFEVKKVCFVGVVDVYMDE